MEISTGGGIVVPGVPSSVPSLFPVFCKCFQRVPYVLRSCNYCYEHSFLYSLLASREHWEQWELDGNGRTCASSAVEQTWNDWVQISVERQPSSKRWIHHVDYALQDACKLLAGGALLLRPCAGTRIALALTGQAKRFLIKPGTTGDSTGTVSFRRDTVRHIWRAQPKV